MACSLSSQDRSWATDAQEAEAIVQRTETMMQIMAFIGIVWVVGVLLMLMFFAGATAERR